MGFLAKNKNKQRKTSIYENISLQMEIFLKLNDKNSILKKNLIRKNKNTCKLKIFHKRSCTLLKAQQNGNIINFLKS